MRSYKQIRAEIAKLEREAEAARKAEAASMIDKLKKLIALYGLTAEDVGLDAGARTERRSRPAADAAVRKASAKKSERPATGAASRRTRTSRSAAANGPRGPAPADAPAQADATDTRSDAAQDEASEAASPASKAKPRRARGAQAGAKQAPARKRPAPRKPARKSEQRAESSAPQENGNALPEASAEDSQAPASAGGDTANEASAA